jgi:hypothetical protein
MPDAIDRQFWGPPADSVAAQYDAKKTHLKQMGDFVGDPARWQELRDTLCSYFRPAKTIADCLSTARAARFVDDIKCDRRRARSALLHMHEIRKRCTVVDLAWIAGILPDAVDDIMDQWLIR